MADVKAPLMRGGRDEMRIASQRVCVVGLGYIGLPTAAVLADRGYQVHGVDIRPHVVETINRGQIHIVEPHLDQLVERVVANGKLRAATQPAEADIFFICVPTPFHEDRSPDLTYVESAARAIRPYIRPGNIVILESTSPPETTTKIVVPQAIPSELTVGQDVFVAYCPERVLPGRILIEVIENDRIVGGVTPACTSHVKEFYETFVRGDVLATNAVAAEMSKLVENAFRDVNIAFANELSMLAEHVGVDPFEVIELANRHPRVKILTPGPGVGGHCISVDPWCLEHASPERTPLIRTARHVNDFKPHFVIERTMQAARQIERPVIGCLGLTYKADVDDIRESPSVEIARELALSGVGTVLVCDPYVTPDGFPDAPVVPLAELLERCHILVLLTDHAEFRALSAEQLAGKRLIDTRGTWRHTLAADSSAASHQQRRAA